MKTDVNLAELKAVSLWLLFLITGRGAREIKEPSHQSEHRRVTREFRDAASYIDRAEEALIVLSDRPFRQAEKGKVMFNPTENRRN